ncbi:glycerol-3-phosphate dehydrogenase [Exophiala xenobiotica]|uniref:Glycerol-3-phosphate dehydrogenase n=1 Tax=Vermiconidia calcicola TaxID=1690605 RepID=A0AAV9QGT5_9PEZI|nr:glycerol-3-phosphate dehydrogenase [Exophiala xenobiotica]KAK5541506.1 glycerol-3-phosphate dehydrogenase [Chaetothyriales sp. CCFEE 6169]KAK5542242.1 glycerol-3-phosphate dehydrogenase [Vermiconidia calcicola]KAK5306729.1 glycerol-3-phosphate dehydrogenase [Exophiala xenobiotica]KAK5341292.1 glycerol-3-phosphate dehydrogenase [Exophiala xenobiotica]
MNPSNRTSNSVPAAKSSTETSTSLPQPAAESNQPSMTATPTRAADATSTNLSHSTSTNSTAPSLRTNTNESEKDLPTTTTKPSLKHTPLIPAPSLASSRYNRQLLVPLFGLQGQQRLLAARVLIIGLGGLGCPAALYLAGAGVGTLGLMDGDVVETSNLHRQIAHTEAAANNPKTTSKVESARDRCAHINSEVRYKLYPTRATPDTLLDVLLNGTETYDVVLDCTDNPATRYLVSDACVVSGTICVSGAAQRGEGSLVVLNNPPKPKRPGVSQQAQAEGQGQARAQSQAQPEEKGPCYRCVFPRPPPPEMVRGCSEIGILGPVVGVIGTLMAGEAIKIIAAGQHLSAPADLSSPGAGTFTSASTPTDRNETTHTTPTTTTTMKPPPRHTMLLYNTYASDPRSMFRTITLRGRRKDCLACGDDEALAKRGLTRITADTIAGEGRLDYQAFCGVADNDDVRLLDDERRIGAREFLEQLDSPDSTSSSSWMARKTGRGRPIVVDVREEHEYELGAKVPGSVNIPISRILRAGGGGGGGGVFDRLLTRLVEPEPNVDNVQDVEEEGREEPVLTSASASASVYFVCQRGNDSQIAAQKLIEYTTETEGAAEPTTETEGAAETTATTATTATTTPLSSTWGWIGDVKGGFLAMERFARSQSQSQHQA